MKDNWISVEDKMPIDIKSIKHYGSYEILIVSGYFTEYCVFTYGPLPKPWYKFGDFREASVTHWRPLPAPPTT